MKMELLILGMLHRGDFHPYEMGRRLSAAHLDRYVAVDPGTLYYAVRRLVAEGRVQVRHHEQVARGGKRTIYGLTQAGRDYFQQALLDGLADMTPVAHPLLPALLFLHLFKDPPAVVARLNVRLAEVRSQSAQLAAMREQVIDVVATGVRHLFNHAIDWCAAEEKLLTGLIDDIQQGRVRDADFERAAAMGLLPKPEGDESVQRRSVKQRNG